MEEDNGWVRVELEVLRGPDEKPEAITARLEELLGREENWLAPEWRITGATDLGPVS